MPVELLFQPRRGCPYTTKTGLLPGDLLRLQKALIEVAQSFSTEPPTEEEVERARTALLKSMEKVQRDSRSLALQLSEWEAMGDWRLFFLYNERLKNVTVSDVTEAAAK